MIEFTEDKMHDNDYTSDDLLGRIDISYMDYCDVGQIANLMTKSFGVSTSCFAVEQLIMTRALFNRSVKVYDKETGDIYGFLILSNHNIADGSPIRMVEPTIHEFLSGFTQIHGYAFALDIRLRNKGIDKRMLSMVNGFVNTFDLVWLAVDGDLRSNSYWKRLGFRELFSIPEATFYGKFGPNVKNQDIYYEMIFFNSEDHNNNRKTGEDICTSGHHGGDMEMVG